MIIEKTYKCCSCFKGMDDLILEAAEDIKNGYHLVRVKQEDMDLSSTYLLSPNVIITLKKEI